MQYQALTQRRLVPRRPIVDPHPSPPEVLHTPQLNVPTRTQPIRPQGCTAGGTGAGGQGRGNRQSRVSTAISDLPNTRGQVLRGRTVPILRLGPYRKT